MSDEPFSYEEFIPTDKWSLQDWYLLKMIKIERIYNRLIKGKYSGGLDRRALIDFYAEISSYYVMARENVKKHLLKKDMEEFIFLMTEEPEFASLEKAERIMELLSAFHWRSGLSKLSESRPMGDFAYARKKLGFDKHGEL